jgi:hypothetical protein
VFLDPRGGEHFDGRWQPPAAGPAPLERLIRDNRLHGADPDAWTAGPRRDRASDIPDAIYLRAASMF